MPRPSVQALGVLELSTIDGLARHCGADIQWTGHGGDHLFFQMRSDVGASDALRAHGVGRAWVEAMRDAARLTRESYWTVLNSTMSAAWRARAAFPAGKQYQIEVLRTLVHRPDPLRGLRAVPELHPLISQPLMEVALRIPTYLLTTGGRGRALARMAFRDLLPADIAMRDSKGGTTVHLAGLLRQNLAFLRECLLDGRLVQEGLLDRQVLEPYLLHGHPLRANQLAPLLAGVAAELWLERIARLDSPGFGEGE
jgi:asparagine synthase (glutamine-hydrolysing)